MVTKFNNVKPLESAVHTGDVITSPPVTNRLRARR